MYLSQEKVADFERDGFVVLPDVFTPTEVQGMKIAAESGERVRSTVHHTTDSEGRSSDLALWFTLGEDIWAAVSTSPRIVNGVRILLQEEVAFFHGKVMLKEARTGGAWEWHQDYGYWYLQGYAFPRLMSVFVAIDHATRENGCLQVLRGSHKLGRLDHGRIGSQTGADPERMGAIEKLFERVYCEMTPGSILFFHPNLLHASSPNTSPHHRRAYITCYNALANPQFVETPTSETRPCPLSPDDAIEQIAVQLIAAPAD